jgi:protease-4
MGRLAALWRVATHWYISALFLAAVGIVVGWAVFFHVFPGKPKIGVIDIPFTVITDDSAFVISEFLDYARRNRDIKAVFIRLNSPGGGAAASEKLFFQMRGLRDEKPVVIVMNDIVASGGYMMSMGASYLYAKPTSLVGSVGVILSFPGPLIPDTPDERIVISGPFKLGGGDRRHWIGLAEQVKQSFSLLVISQRGEKLHLSPQELTQARIYAGVEAMRLGLVDAIGDDTDGIEKAASLAGISDYELVDVNVEVFRSMVQKFRRIFEASEGQGVQSNQGDIRTLMALSRGKGEALQPLDTVANMPMLRRLFLPSGIGETQKDSLPGFPLKVTMPNLYYLYVGPAQ